jgi:pectin methylesterase-like acyl-CoA thioesterase
MEQANGIVKRREDLLCMGFKETRTYLEKCISRTAFPALSAPPPGVINCFHLDRKSSLCARDTIQVQSGQSIQAAIHAAHTGDKIVVGAGNYAEQLTIKKDGITLIGQGAVLAPPATPLDNACSGLAGPDTQAGICVA